jgi:hypothetical protein
MSQCIEKNVVQSKKLMPDVAAGFSLSKLKLAATFYKGKPVVIPNY